VVAVVHRYTQKTWAFLVGQRHRQTPEISQGNAHVYDVGIYHCFWDFWILAIFWPQRQ